jgi:DNA modification methylase
VTVLVLQADARNLPLPDGCVDLVVTSPPYFGLRSYTDGGEHYAGQLGSEATPAAYIEALVACTREWMRVLKPSGSIFVNLGDKYATRYASLRGGGRAGLNGDDDSRGRSGQNRTGAGEKSLLGLPWRYALACLDQLGLILRAEIIWAKPNGLPESVQDRVRRAHEQVFHFTRQPRYYSAVDEIREPHTGNAHPSGNGSSRRWLPSNGGVSHRALDTDPAEYNPLGKLPGSVWSIPSQPLTVPPHLGVDHFAAFPMELPRRLISGWSPREVCSGCGQGRRPIVDRVTSGYDNSPLSRTHRINGGMGGTQFNRMKALGGGDRLTGYTCDCPAPTAPTTPGLVVDPFGGTGTTGLLAHTLGRNAITTDLSADYCRIATWRTADRGEIARAMQVDKPPPVSDLQEPLWA